MVMKSVRIRTASVFLVSLTLLGLSVGQVSSKALGANTRSSLGHSPPDAARLTASVSPRSIAARVSAAPVTAVVSALPGGGSLYTYAFSDGQIDYVPVPPANFNPLSASAQVLAEYNFPTVRGLEIRAPTG